GQCALLRIGDDGGAWMEVQPGEPPLQLVGGLGQDETRALDLTGRKREVQVPDPDARRPAGLPRGDRPAECPAGRRPILPDIAPNQRPDGIASPPSGNDPHLTRTCTCTCDLAFDL